MKRDLVREREISKAVGAPRTWRPPPTFAPRRTSARIAAVWVRRRERAIEEEKLADQISGSVSPELEFTS